jgi:type I restriction enzyme, S subunit
MPKTLKTNGDAPPNGFKQTELGLIPKEWEVIKLSSVADTKSGGTPSRTEARYFGGHIPWVKSGELDDNIIQDTEEKITEEGLEESSARIFPAGTLLLAMYGATVGKTAVLGREATTNQAICAISPKDNAFLPPYLQYYFIAIRPQLLQARYGGAQPNISQTLIRDVSIVLPPLPEQRAIAYVLSKIQAAAQTQAAIAERARELKRALMAKLFTEGLRGEPLKETEIGPMPESWSVGVFGDFIASGPQNGIYKHSQFYGSGTPIVRIDNFNNDGDFTPLAFKCVRVSNDERAIYELKEQDILINRVNSLSHIGKSTLVPQLPKPTIFESNMMRMALDNSRLLPEYMIRFLCSPRAKVQFLAKAKRAVAQSSINQGDVKSLLFPLPMTLDEQHEIACILQTVDAKITAAERKRAGLEELFRAMLGELMTGRVRVPPVMLRAAGAKPLALNESDSSGASAPSA